MRLNLDIAKHNKKQNLFFTSDFHLFHKNVLKFDNRPFTGLEEMHDTLLERWNKTVSDNDIVVYVGDLSFSKSGEKRLVKEFVDELNGKIHFVLGNHDKNNEIRDLGRFDTVSDYLEIRLTHFSDEDEIIQTLFCCMHYPIYSWNVAHHGSYMIHGHCHGNLHHGESADFYINRRVIDVGCMLHNYTPISHNEVVDKLKDVKLPELRERN